MCSSQQNKVPKNNRKGIRQHIMRKICAKSLALLLTVAFCFAAFGAAALAANATATSNLNKRSSPSTSASVITVLKRALPSPW